jgi:hypothetical protein
VCLADGTPIAVLAVSACVDCGAAAAAPAVSGWLNLTNGVYTPGAPPAGVQVCAPQQQFEVGQWCDLAADGTVIAPVLVEYEYDDQGALIGVRTLTPAGNPYTVVGTLGLCPGPAGDVEYKIMCDVQADGSVVRFIRGYVPNGDGTAATDDIDLDGNTYTPTGTVGICADCETTQVCVRPSGRVEFLTNPENLNDGSVDTDWTWSPSRAGPWWPTYRLSTFPGWTTVDGGTAEGQAHWVAPHPGGGLFNTGRSGEGPNVPAPPSSGDWYVKASFPLPANADPASIRISTTALNADQIAVEWRLNGGPWQAVNRNHTQPPYVLPPTAVPGAQAGLNEVLVHVRETVAGGGAAGLLLHVIAEYDVDASSFVMWTRVTCDDGRVYYLDENGVRQNALPAGWSTVPCEDRGATPLVLGTVCYGAGGGVIRTAAVLRCAGCADNAVTYVDVATGDPVEAPTIVECPPQGCDDCETLLLCDYGADVPATITGQGVSSGTLANGVAWSVRGTGNNAIPSKVSNSDGAWFGKPEIFPNPVIPPYTFTFSQPSIVEFSVYMMYSATWPEADDNCMQLPAGVEAVELPPGFTFDPVTSRVCVTAEQTGDPCPNLTNPTRAVSARFRTAEPVVRLVTRFLGVRYARCGQFQSSWVGAFSVTPTGQFLRHICRDCDGVATVTNTLLDGTTAYAPVGAVGVCQPAPDPAGVESVLLCDITTVTTPGEAPERITNGRFAADTSGWTISGGAAYVPTGGPDGQVGVLDFSQGNQAAGRAEQTTTVTPGLTYNLSARIGIWSTGGTTPQRVLVEVLDGSGAVLHSQTVAPAATSGGPLWPADGVVGPVPIVATDTTMTVRFTDQVGGDFIDALLDNVSLLGPGVPGETTTEAVPFLRHYTLDAVTGAATYVDTTLDGAPYAASPDVDVCPAAAAGDVTVEAPPAGEVILYDPAAVPGACTPFVRHYVRDELGNVTGHVDTTLDGGVYLPAGPPVAQCEPAAVPDPVVTVDAEAVLVCAGGVTYERRTLYASDGSSTVEYRDGAGSVVAAPAGPFTLGPCAGAAAAGPVEVLDECRCDDTPGGLVRYVELFAVDADGTVTSIGTRTEDLSAPYLPVNPVDCPGGATIVPADEPVMTGLIRATDTTPRNLSADYPGLQSVTLTVITGTVDVTCSAFGAAVPAGVSLTWSVSDDDDSAVAGWSCTGQAGADYLLHWTYKATAAG